MGQTDFSYNQSPTGAANSDAAPLPISVSIFVDRPHLRAEIRDDCVAAGFRVGTCCDIEQLVDGDIIPLGDVVLLDCPQSDGRLAAALSRLDVRVAHAGAQLVVSTTVNALDDVFGCLDQSQPQILVEPSRAERVIALGRVLARMPNLRLRELSEEDRLVLLRLTEQVGQIAERLERMPNDTEGALAGAQVDDSAAFRFESPAPGFKGSSSEDGSERLVRVSRAPMPDPRLVRRIIRQRQLRARFFDGDLFGDPAWDILLDLTAARVEHTRVSVTSLCIASGVPPTTALRWISQMTEAGLLMRVEDETDRRRAFITLTDKAAEGMARYFAEIGKSAAQLV